MTGTEPKAFLEEMDNAGTDPDAGSVSEQLLVSGISGGMQDLLLDGRAHI